MNLKNISKCSVPEFDAFYSVNCDNGLSSCNQTTAQVQTIGEWHLYMDASFSWSLSQPAECIKTELANSTINR